LYFAVRGFYSPGRAAELLGLGRGELESTVDEMLGETIRGKGLGNGRNGVVSAEALNRLELRRYMHDQLLRDTDAFSMAHSIEVRVPYLDHLVVECAARFPAAEKVGDGVNKPLLVRATDDAVLAETARRKKMGFTFPMDEWMKQQAGPLREMALGAGTPLERKAVGECWDAFEAGRLHWSRAWGLVVAGAVSNDEI